MPPFSPPPQRRDAFRCRPRFAGALPQLGRALALGDGAHVGLLSVNDLARIVEAGERVVVDATFRFAADRRAFAAARGDTEPPVWIECRAPASVLADRAARRAKDLQRVSDADAGIVGRQIEEWEPLDEIPDDKRVAVATEDPAAEVVAAVAEILDKRLQRL